MPIVAPAPVPAPPILTGPSGARAELLAERTDRDPAQYRRGNLEFAASEYSTEANTTAVAIRAALSPSDLAAVLDEAFDDAGLVAAAERRVPGLRAAIRKDLPHYRLGPIEIHGDRITGTVLADGERPTLAALQDLDIVAMRFGAKGWEPVATAHLAITAASTPFALDAPGAEILVIDPEFLGWRDPADHPLADHEIEPLVECVRVGKHTTSARYGIRVELDMPCGQLATSTVTRFDPGKEKTIRLWIAPHGRDVTVSVDDREVPFVRVDEGTMTIELPVAKPVTIRVDAQLDLAKDHLGRFFRPLDPAYVGAAYVSSSLKAGNRNDLELVVVAPAAMTPKSAGPFTTRDLGDGRIETTFPKGSPSVAFSTAWRVATSSTGAVEVAISAASDEVLEDALAFVGSAWRALLVLGPMPDERTCIVVSGRGFEGLNLGRGLIIVPDMRNRDLIRHELAHKWFGSLVTARFEADEAALHETLASIAAHIGADPDDLAATRRQRAWLVAREASKPSPQPVLGFARDTTAAHARTLAYSRATQILDMVALRFGDDRLVAALADLVARFGHKSARWSDLLESIQRTCGADASTWVRGWLTRGGGPDITIARATKIAGGVAIELAQSEPPWDAYVEVVGLDASGTRVARTVVHANTATTRVTLADPRIERVVVDPESRTPRLYTANSENLSAVPSTEDAATPPGNRAPAR